MTLPIVIILVGSHVSGKTTWADIIATNSNYLSSVVPTRVISQDIFIEAYANSIGKPYREVFNDFARKSKDLFNEDLKTALDNGENIIIDRMNGTGRSREKILQIIKRSENRYLLAAVQFMPSAEEILKRWQSQFERGIHKVDKKTLEDNIARAQGRLKEEWQWTWPLKSEGFDYIYDNPYEALHNTISYLHHQATGKPLASAWGDSDLLLPEYLQGTRAAGAYMRTHFDIDPDSISWLVKKQRIADGTDTIKRPQPA